MQMNINNENAPETGKNTDKNLFYNRKTTAKTKYPSFHMIGIDVKIANRK